MLNKCCFNFKVSRANLRYFNYMYTGINNMLNFSRNIMTDDKLCVSLMNLVPQVCPINFLRISKLHILLVSSLLSRVPDCYCSLQVLPKISAGRFPQSQSCENSAMTDFLNYLNPCPLHHVRRQILFT